MSENASTLPPLTIPGQAVLEGGLRYPGKIIVNGTVLGDVWCSDIVVTERGCVEGTICGKSVTILGEASGAIYGNHVTLKTACLVTAEIFHSNLSLENGCYFEGKSRRVASPLSLSGWNAGEHSTSDGLVR